MSENCDHCHPHGDSDGDQIDHVTDLHGSDPSDDDDDDLESTSSSISFDTSIPDEDINFDLVYALHSFAAVVTGQASVIKGDALILMDDSNSYWWLVEVLKTRELGYIPAENTETPFERLARLNKHRNVDITTPNNDDLMDPVPRTKRPKKVTLGPEDEYQLRIFERDDDDYDNHDFDDDAYVQDYDCDKNDYGYDYDDNDSDGHASCVVLDSEPVDHLTAALGIKHSDNGLEDDGDNSDEDDMDAFEDARQDFGDGSLDNDNNAPALEEAPVETSPLPLTAQPQQTIEQPITTTTDQQPVESGKRGLSIMAPHTDDRTNWTEPLRVFGGNITQGLLFHTFDIGISTTAQDLLTMAIERFNLDVGFDTIEYYLSVQGLDGDDYILLAQDKPLPIFRTLTASLTTPMPRSSMEQRQQIAKAKERLSFSSTNDLSNSNSISNRRRSTSFSNYEQTYHDEDSLIRFYLHQRIKRGRAGLLYIKVCLCRGGVGQKRSAKHKAKGTIDRMEKIMAVQVDSQVGMVINEALAKFNVPDATAENFLGGLGDVRLFTKYRMSVRTMNDIEMPLQATQDMATLLNLLQIKWNVGERTLLTSDLLFMLFPSGGIRKGQHKGSRDASQDYQQQDLQQERRPSILDILMDSPGTKESSSSSSSCQEQQQDQGELGVAESPILDHPLTLQQKSSPECNWNPCSPSSIPIHNHHRRSSQYSTISDSSIPDSLTDDMTFGFTTDKRATLTPSPKSSSLKQYFKRWVGWGSKKGQQQYHQQQHLSPTSANSHHPLAMSSSCVGGDIVESSSSSFTLAPQDSQVAAHHPNGSIISLSRSIPSPDQKEEPRRPSNCTTESSSSSSNMSRSEPALETTSSNNNAGDAPVASTETHGSIATSMPSSLSDHSITKTSSASMHSQASDSPAATTTASWDHDSQQQQQQPENESLVESDISSLSNSSSSDNDSTMDGPSGAGEHGDTDQAAYEWFSDSDDEDSDTEGGDQQQSSSHTGSGSQDPDDIMTQYSTWMQRASLDATSIMNQPSTTHAAPPSRSSVAPSVASSASSSSSSSQQQDDKDVAASSSPCTDSSPSQTAAGCINSDDSCYQEKPLFVKAHQPPISFPSTSLDTDALLLVTHGVDFLKNRESSNWEDDDAHCGDDDRYAFHPWTRSDKSSDVSSLCIDVPPPPPTLSTTASVISSHRKKPSVTPSPTSSTATIIVPGPKVTSHPTEKKLGEGTDDELHRIVSMHVLF